MDELMNILKQIVTDKTQKIVLSNSIINSGFRRINVTNLNGKFNVEYYNLNMISHENIEYKTIIDYLIANTKNFRQVNVWNIDYFYDIKFSKKGKLLFNKTRIKYSNNVVAKTDKNYILKEGMIIPPLIDLGIFTKDGKVVNSMQGKYRQINRFLELIDDSLKNTQVEELNIVDFGCGKSYLTFILYYYLTYIKKIKVDIVGLDLKKNVVENCNAIAIKYKYDNLKFELGNIDGYKPIKSIDMVITLHACDVATDFALYNAIKWNAKMIFYVPCCQHELNSQIKSSILDITTRYGIVQERIAALYTDIIRCNLLEAMSYKVQLLEFIDFDSTPKNLLIRASLSNIPENVKKIMINEVDEIMKCFSLNPKLYVLLSKEIAKIKNSKVI